ncbi:flavin reductase family protein [Nocardioides sp. NPDC126508]
MTTVDFFDGLIETLTDVTSPALVDSDTFRDSMARVCAPVTIVATAGFDGPYATTVSAFTSLSLDPPMVMVSLGKQSNLLSHVRTSRRISVNVLSAEQADLALMFARSGEDKFDGVAWQSRDGLPHFPGTVTWLSCRVDRFVDGGDHAILIATVAQAEISDDPPLVYARHKFGTHDGLKGGGQ